MGESFRVTERSLWWDTLTHVDLCCWAVSCQVPGSPRITIFPVTICVGQRTDV
jgi:hypothetical protein